MTVIYREQDGDLSLLAGKVVSVIGYGSLGRPVALKLRDSGVQIVVGTRSEEGLAAAEEDGIPSKTVEEAVKTSDILLLMLPDDAMPPFYLEQISPHLRRGHMLVFSSAYNITYRFIEPPPFVDIGLIAPRALAANLQHLSETDEGYASFVAVGQDASGNAWPQLLALAQGMGALQTGAIEISFEQEAELDLFIQQTIMPALHHLMTTAASLLLGRGYPPEAVFTELYLSGEFSNYLKLAAEQGLLNTLRTTPPMNQYGTISRLDRFYDLKLERLMEVTLDEIHSGAYSREWSKEQADGNRRLDAFYKNQQNLEVWELEQQTLDLFGRESEYDE